MGRILAIDYGQKRVGLAVTDPLQIIASALDTIPVHELMKFLSNYFEREKVDLVIIGKPLQMNGNESSSMNVIKPFVAAFKKKFPQIELKYVDERFTSILAKKTMIEAGLKKKDRQNKATVDKISATIILQSYLESQKIEM